MTKTPASNFNSTPLHLNIISISNSMKRPAASLEPENEREKSFRRQEPVVWIFPKLSFMGSCATAGSEDLGVELLYVW